MPRLKHSTDRGRETLQALRDALMALIVEKGYGSVTIKDITERAGVDRTTFYLHAQSKRELFKITQQQMIDELFADVGCTAELHGQRAYKAFLYIGMHADAYRALLTVDDPETNPGMLPYGASHITRMLRASGIVSDVPFDLLAAFAASAFRGLVLWWLEHHQPLPAERMAEVYTRLMLGGLSGFVPAPPDAREVAGGDGERPE